MPHMFSLPRIAEYANAWPQGSVSTVGIGSDSQHLYKCTFYKLMLGTYLTYVGWIK